MAGTAKGRALGGALRKARTERKLSLRQLAAKINRQPGVLSTWETGTHIPKPDQVAQILVTLEITGDRYDEIIALAYDNDAPLWVATSLPERLQQLSALVDFEQNAATLTDVSPLMIPGPLQTSNYIRAAMIDARIPAGDVAARVAMRIGRRDVIDRSNDPVQYIALVGQTALTHVIGDRAIMAEQLRFVIKMAQRPNLTVRAIRSDSGWHPALEGPFYLIEFADMAPLVHLENRRSGLFLHKSDDVGVYKLAAESVLKATMSESETIKLIADLIARMENST